ncbi:hypothetical protein FOWG_17896 [Fusarium oxysporum f. sp. lycopersici MN25]|nr:hypothetical protein FOWG_17896 [Fusarium oxysporum f. sp. lycopersici MN25]
MATIYCRDVSPPVSIIDALKRINIDLYSVTHEAGVKPTRQRGKDVNVSVPSTVEVPQGITQMVACTIYKSVETMTAFVNSRPSHELSPVRKSASLT